MPAMNPVLSGAIVAFVNAILAVVTNFGVSLTDTQKGSITALVNAALVLGGLVYAYAHKQGKQSPPPTP